MAEGRGMTKSKATKDPVVNPNDPHNDFRAMKRKAGKRARRIAGAGRISEKQMAKLRG